MYTVFVAFQAYSPLGSSEKNLAHDPVVEKVSSLIQQQQSYSISVKPKLLNYMWFLRSHSKHLTTGSQQTEQDPRAGAHQVGPPKGNKRYSQIDQGRKNQREHPSVWMGDP